MKKNYRNNNNENPTTTTRHEPRRVAHLLGASQSAHWRLPGTWFLSVAMVWASMGCPWRVLLLFDSLPWSEYRICCSMAVTHSSLSSWLPASKCHCLLSRDTRLNS